MTEAKFNLVNGNNVINVRLENTGTNCISMILSYQGQERVMAYFCDNEFFIRKDLRGSQINMEEQESERADLIKFSFNV